MKKVILVMDYIFIFMMPLLLYYNYNSSVIFLLFLLSIFRLYRTDIMLKMKFLLLIFDILVVLPTALNSNSYFIDIATQICIYSILAVGLNIVVGFAGLLDLGYVAFYAAGAYVYAIFASNQANNFLPKFFVQFPISGEWFWVFLIFAMIVSAIVGIVLGLPVLRLKGDYLAIVTLGFGEIIRIILNNLDKPINITNGPRGITPISPPRLFGIEFNSPINYYFITIFILIIVIFFVNRVNYSRIGRSWAAIREDELAARSMGISLVKMKLMAFAYGASLAGMAGVVFSAKQTFIEPTSFGFMESIGILAMVILGGLGSISGAVTGATILVLLKLLILKDFSEFLGNIADSGLISIPTELDPAKYERLVFGIILVLACIFRPKGILPGKRSIEYLKKMLPGDIQKINPNS
ncbi:MAG: branched-chain amino acid ABC transporter permease [Clostridiales bacterium]